MIRFPNCKINLGLRILRRRPDGYHDIETVMVPVGWRDILEIVPSADAQTTLTVSGIAIEGQLQENLCYKAWQLLHKQYEIPIAAMHLHKMVPAGAGLGGGSSNAAFALRMMNDLFCLSLTTSELQLLAGQLGMDCPFFIENRAVVATGRGDVFSPVNIELNGYYLMVVKPPFGVNTARAYQGCSPCDKGAPISEILQKPVPEWKGLLVNDFEKPVFAMHPEIEEIKHELYAQGAIYASMSGSGSAVFGLFENKPGLTHFDDCEMHLELFGSQDQ